jgi:tRNA(fMet)-specific endonuclease VapC
MNYLLDSNMISFILEDNKKVVAEFEERVEASHMFLACPVVYFEVRRGLLARDSRTKMGAFEALFTTFDWQDYNHADWTLATELWKERRNAGRPIADADLLITVFAINRNAIPITDNEKDFDGLSVKLQKWKDEV